MGRQPAAEHRLQSQRKGADEAAIAAATGVDRVWRPAAMATTAMAAVDDHGQTGEPKVLLAGLAAAVPRTLVQEINLVILEKEKVRQQRPTEAETRPQPPSSKVKLAARRNLA